jgi:ABC-type multidrug transport system ATPase subunit
VAEPSDDQKDSPPFALRLLTDGGEGEREWLAGEKVTVGRESDSEITLRHPQVSRMHAALSQAGDGYYLEDLGSTNGTYVDGRRLTAGERVLLQGGERVRFGGAEFLFERAGASRAPVRGLDNRPPVRLDVRHLVQRVPRRGRPLTLLDDVSFTVYPNEVVAIVGASGAGKSTLIKALNGMRPAVEGEVLLNGVSFYEHLDEFYGAIGYVPQDDIIHRELPVESVLRYAARLRLPAGTPDAEVHALIDEVLTELDLTHRREAIVSTLSGGERKRVNIAVELLTRPRVLLLDEPTSGLDPGLERRVVALIRRLAHEGRTVLFVTHATESIAQCDLVLFLARGGKVAFYGPPQDALEFFGVQEFAEAYLKVSSTDEDGRSWPERFRRSPFYREYVEERKRDARKPGPAPLRSTGGPRLSALAQFGLLARRYVEVIRGDLRNLLILLLQAPAIAAILALIYKSNTFSTAPASTPGGLPPLQSAPELLFLIVVAALWFGTTNSAREISKERTIFMRERLAGLRSWPYLFSKIAVLGALCLMQSAALLFIVGTRVDYHVGGAVVGQLFGTLFLTSLTATLLGLTISAWASSTDQAMSMVPLAILPQVILSGMLIPLDGLGPLRWLSSFMPGRWAYGALSALTELGDRFDKVGLGRQAKDVFDTAPATAWCALGLIGALCLVAAWSAIALRERE